MQNLHCGQRFRMLSLSSASYNRGISMDEPAKVNQSSATATTITTNSGREEAGEEIPLPTTGHGREETGEEMDRHHSDG